MSRISGGAAALSLLPTRHASPAPLVGSHFAFLRFVAGVRALFALLAGLALVMHGVDRSPAALVVGPYLLVAAAVLLQTLMDPPSASAERWLWIDAIVLAIVSRLLENEAAWLGVTSVVPVVAMSVLAGPGHGFAMAIVSAALMVVPGPLEWTSGEWVNVPLAVPLAVLAFGPAAALLSLPSRELRQRLQLVDAFNASVDPRQGLLHHVDVLLGLLATRFGADAAVLSLQGPQPRIFRRSRGGGTCLLDDAQAACWHARRAALRDTAGCLCSSSGRARAVGVSMEGSGEKTFDIEGEAREVLLAMAPESAALLLMSYGKPLGHLCLERQATPFTVADLRWLRDAMRELVPLLERCDLLEQLQRETAAAERERIGRDLHDSAVQPYLGLKYGLEALARRATRDNPLAPALDQLVQLTNDELQRLRDVVTGLRKGDDPAATTVFMEALQRQAARFEALYGLKVNIDASQAVGLRGSVASAVLHMFNEALTNVRRHTAATTVTVSLDMLDDGLAMTVRNDHGGARPPASSFVPRSLTERAIEVGGGVTVDVREDSTAVSIRLPLFRSFG